MSYRDSMTQNHDWDGILGKCRKCGLTEDDYLNTSEWFALFCTGKEENIHYELPKQEKFCNCDIKSLLCNGCACGGK